MSKRALIGLISLTLLASLVAMPAAAQETVRGFFEGPNFGYNAGTGVIPLTGWALSTSGVRRVVIKVDGQLDGQVEYGQFRPDVLDAFPGFPDSAGAGFTYNLNSTRYANGAHTVTAEVLTNAGTQRLLEEVHTVFFTNNTSTLEPFGEIDRPHRNAVLYGNCDSIASNRIYTWVHGWALDLGVEAGGGGSNGGAGGVSGGVRYVELTIDGQPLSNTKTSCAYIQALGGPVNCYGLPRQDIERRFPFAPDAPNAGFRFLLDIGALIVNNVYLEGQHTLGLRIGDEFNVNDDAHDIPVHFRCEHRNSNNEGSFGFIEQPRPGVIVAGNTTFVGWALDIDGVQRVEIRVDGSFVGRATYGVDSRPNVAIQYPGFPDSGAPVWSFVWDSTTVTDGFHQIQVMVSDERGDETLVGEHTFFVDNGID